MQGNGEGKMTTTNMFNADGKCKRCGCSPNKKIISKRWKDKNKEKLIAENKFLYAVRHKYILIEPCQICGKKAHGHHSDYSKPYDVNWLCPLHHKAMHLGEISDLKIYHYDVNYTIIQKTLFHD
jgi:hypothetical protein